MAETPDELVRAVLEEFPHLSGSVIDVPSQGKQGKTVFIGNEVFKAPSPEHLSSFEREVCVLVYMQDRTSAPIPSITCVGRETNFFGMQRMSGVKLTSELAASLEPNETLHLASDLAQFMLDMNRGFSPDDAISFGFPTIDHYALRTDRQVVAVCHSDLNSNNLLFDLDTRRLSGIIDFGLVTVRSPILDLATLGDMPRDLLDQIAKLYDSGGGQQIDVGQAVQIFHTTYVHAADWTFSEMSPSLRDPIMDNLREKPRYTTHPRHRVRANRAKIQHG